MAIVNLRAINVDTFKVLQQNCYVSSNVITLAVDLYPYHAKKLLKVHLPFTYKSITILVYTCGGVYEPRTGYLVHLTVWYRPPGPTQHMADTIRSHKTKAEELIKDSKHKTIL